MRQYIIVFIVLLIIINIWLYPKTEPVYHEDITSLLPSYFEVELTGAVVFPGRYRFFEPTTLNQVITYAGGFLNDADLSNVQLAERIDKNRQIHVQSNKTDEEVIIQKININKASFKTLIEIPHMTETRAASLIVYREANGPFLHFEELLNVKHIGSVTLENIKPYITLN